MPKNTDKIQEIINKSGNNLHSQVVKFLRKNEWTVLISPYYCDNQTNKAREIDIIAEKEYDVFTTSQEYGTLNVKLYIECKYLNDELVFWFDEKDIVSAEKMVIETTCIPENIKAIPIGDRQHHYFSRNNVAKLFSSDTKKFHENEDFFRAVNQTLNGMIYHRKKGSIIGSRKQKKFQHMAHYPLILCNNFDKLYKISIGEQEYHKIDTSDFELEINYSYIGNSARVMFDKYFLIDVVDFTKFEKYLEKIITKDIKEMTGYATH